jgi:hypothetical protein
MTAQDYMVRVSDGRELIGSYIVRGLDDALGEITHGTELGYLVRVTDWRGVLVATNANGG